MAKKHALISILNIAAVVVTHAKTDIIVTKEVVRAIATTPSRFVMEKKSIRITMLHIAAAVTIPVIKITTVLVVLVIMVLNPHVTA